MDRCYIFRRLIVIPIAIEILPRAAAQSTRGPLEYPYGIGEKVNSSMKITLALLICGMFFVAFFSFYIRKCLEDTAGGSRHSRQRFPCGLQRSVVDSFPVLLYSDVKVLKIGNGALECAVCISEFADDEILRFLPKCHHVFHPDCIDAWFASHTTCPICRANLTPDNLDGKSESNYESTHSQIGGSRTETGSQNQCQIHVEEERVAPKFSRSHSTGHTLIPPGENCERYTLRLPVEVHKQIVTLKRANSCGCGVDGNSRRGTGVDGDGSSGGRRWNPDRLFGRSDLWNFTVTRTPVFVAKNERSQSSSSTTAIPV